MQAQPAHQPQQSQITITFGDHPGEAGSPFALTLAAQYNSSKIQNKRFNAGEYLNMQIPNNSILFEVEAKGDGQDVAKQFMKLHDASEVIKGHQDANQIKLKVVGKDNKVYVLFTAPQIQQIIQKFNNKIKQQAEPTQAKQERWLQIKIRSNNKLQRINQILQQKGKVFSFFDSLGIDIKFTKTQSITSLVHKILSKGGLGAQTSQSLIDTFQNFNLALKFQSSKALQAYPKLLEDLKAIKINDDFKPLKSQLGNKMEAFIFGNPISFYGLVVSEDLWLMLDILLA